MDDIHALFHHFVTPFALLLLPAVLAGAVIAISFIRALLRPSDDL